MPAPNELSRADAAFVVERYLDYARRAQKIMDRLVSEMEGACAEGRPINKARFLDIVREDPFPATLDMGEGINQPDSFGWDTETTH